MKPIVYISIAARIVLLILVGMAFTFIPSHLREFFGDTIRQREGYSLDSWYDWGARHYWYFWGCFFLFILTLINFIAHIVTTLKKHYPKLF